MESPHSRYSVIPTIKVRGSSIVSVSQKTGAPAPRPLLSLFSQVSIFGSGLLLVMSPEAWVEALAAFVDQEDFQTSMEATTAACSSQLK